MPMWYRIKVATYMRVLAKLKQNPVVFDEKEPYSEHYGHMGVFIVNGGPNFTHCLCKTN